MAREDSIISTQAWPIVALCVLTGGLLLALGAGLLTEEKVPYVATIGAGLVAFAGMVIMWKSEHVPSH